MSIDSSMKPSMTSPVNQVEVVMGMHEETVEQLFRLGLSLQQLAAHHAVSPPTRGHVDELTAMLDATIRSVLLSAFAMRRSFASVDPTQVDAQMEWLDLRDGRPAPAVVSVGANDGAVGSSWTD